MKKLGERIYLRPLQLGDAKKMVATSKIDEFRYLTGTAKPFTLLQVEEHIVKISNDDSRCDLAICLNDTDQMIGELSIMDIDEMNQSAGFRIAMINIQQTGKGYGTEAIDLVLNFVFEELCLNRLQLEVYSYNLRGIKAYEKAGFVKEGALREALFINGNYSDEIIMSILRSEYKKIKTHT